MGLNLVDCGIISNPALHYWPAGLQVNHKLNLPVNIFNSTLTALMSSVYTIQQNTTKHNKIELTHTDYKADTILVQGAYLDKDDGLIYW